MMRRCIACLLLLTFMLSSAIAIYADAIWTPPDDFFETHMDKCKSLNRSFYINSERGYISVKKEPGSGTEVDAVINGEVYNVFFTYSHNGALWGVILLDNTYTPGKQQATGWIPMDQLLLVYDKISFEEDHRQEFYSYSGSYDALFETDELIFWTWPGSGKIAMTHDDPVSLREEPARSWLNAECAYRDSEGREWGLIPYFYAAKRNWVCLSDPGNENITAFNRVPKPELWPAVDPPATNRAEGSGQPFIIIIILVAALVVSSVVLIRLFWKPKKRVNE